MDRGRVLSLLAIFILPLLGLEARLVYLQIIAAPDPTAVDRRLTPEILRTQRGPIVDVKGRHLAQDVRSFDCYVVLEEYEKNPGPLGPLIGMAAEDFQAALGSIYEKIEKQVNRRPANERVRLYKRERRAPYLLKRDIPFEAAIAIETSAGRYGGVVVRESLKRVYPWKESFCHGIGYLGRVTANEKVFTSLLQKGYFFEGFEELIGQDGVARLFQRGAFHEELIGVSGLEKKYDEELRGKPGLIILERQAGTSQKRIIELKPAEPGTPIELTIDIEAQRDIERLLDGPTPAAAAVIDPMSGAVVALASNRQYDPNDFTPPGNAVRIRAAFADNENKPLLSRAFQDHYQHGSAAKIVTSVAGLEDKVVSASDLLPCRGKFDENQKFFNCWIWTEFRGMHGEVNLHQALEKSCNCYYFEVGKRCGIESIIRWGRAMGFGAPTGIDLTGEAPGRMPDRGRQQNDVLSLAIGQHELMVTPLQAAVMVSAIANGGRRVTPYVRRDRPQTSAAIGIAPATLKEVQQGLYDVTHAAHGTAHTTSLKDFKAVGKTSSAQAEKGKQSHAWFVGYAPYDAPRYAFAVLLLNAGHGGEAAAPVAAKILQRLMKPPSEAQAKDGQGQ